MENIISNHLKVLWTDNPPNGYLNLWRKDTSKTIWFRSNQFDEIAEKAIELSNQTNAYYSVGLYGNQLPESQRGTADMIIAIPGLWFDFDYGNDHHKKADLPKDRETTIEFVESLKHKPTMIISSGYGLHVYWLFKKPWVFDNGDYFRAKKLSEYFQSMILQEGMKHGWKLDNTSALNSILRLPGTINNKSLDNPVPVEVLRYSDEVRYEIDEFEIDDDFVPSYSGNNGYKRNVTNHINVDHIKLDDNTIKEGDRNTTLTQLAGYMRNRSMSQKSIEVALLEENRLRCSPPLDENEVKNIARNINKYKPGQSFKLTELGNAERLVSRFGYKIRYNVHRGKWVIYDGKRWIIDEKHMIRNLAKKVIREIYIEANGVSDDGYRKKLYGHARQSESAKSIANMIELAKGEKNISLDSNVFDSNDYLLNCLNGTINLKSGILQPHNHADMITKIVPVEYDPNAKCPVFIKFIQEIMNYNADLVTYIQRIFGYALTGSTDEQCLFIFHGNGANGKSTLLNIFRESLNNYVKSADFCSFSYKGNAIRNDLARLSDARLVTTVEIENGKFFNEAVINKLTGGDSIISRYLNQEFFEYTPKFKLIIACNYKPGISGVNYAIWRRIKLIPFEVTIPENRRDRNLLDKLRDELPGILSWSIRGCLDWQKYRFPDITDVKKATDDYRNESDTIGTFINEKYKLNTHGKVKRSELYNDYKNWCTINNEEAIGKQDFKQNLKSRGMTIKKQSGNEYCYGISS